MNKFSKCACCNVAQAITIRSTKDIEVCFFCGQFLLLTDGINYSRVLAHELEQYQEQLPQLIAKQKQSYVWNSRV